MKSTMQTISEVKLIYRTKVRASDRPQIKCSKDAYDIFKENFIKLQISKFILQIFRWRANVLSDTFVIYNPTILIWYGTATEKMVNFNVRFVHFLILRSVGLNLKLFQFICSKRQLLYLRIENTSLSLATAIKKTNGQNG